MVKRVKIRVARREAQEDAAPSGRRLPLLEGDGGGIGGKRLTPRQHRELSERYGDRWEGQMLQILERTERSRSRSVSSEELAGVLNNIDGGDDDETKSVPHSNRIRTKDGNAHKTVDTAGNAALAEVLQQLDEADDISSLEDSDDVDF
ncbi:unnamed protein product [Phytophthora lilii]|uniref:Unnamed protein product n=1 Tax=Phytophthora lilii TaxID=2077276 RepID=A0A9W6U2J3_9STRA|nr:unnamed protein product [Phytophthora lilii]